MRTVRGLDNGDFKFLFFLCTFGAKQILNDELKYAQFMTAKIEKENLAAESSKDKRFVQECHERMQFIK